MTIFWGAGGTLKETFVAIMNQKIEVTVGLLAGGTASGWVTAHPGDEYVILEQPVPPTMFDALSDEPPSPAQEPKRVLVTYKAIATVEEVRQH